MLWVKFLEALQEEYKRRFKIVNAICKYFSQKGDLFYVEQKICGNSIEKRRERRKIRSISLRNTLDSQYILEENNEYNFKTIRAGRPF